MAIFSNKQILSAVFTNNANDTIEIVYNHSEEGETPKYISIWISATDPQNESLVALKQAGWSLERIQRQTHLKLEDQKKAYEAIIDARIALQLQVTKEQVASMYEQRYSDMLKTGPVITTTIFQSVLENNTDEEILFKSKLAAFEIPQIKDLKDRAFKQKIRTAKSLMELFGVLYSIFEETK